VCVALALLLGLPTSLVPGLARPAIADVLAGTLVLLGAP